MAELLTINDPDVKLMFACESLERAGEILLVAEPGFGEKEYILTPLGWQRVNPFESAPDPVSDDLADFELWLLYHIGGLT